LLSKTPAESLQPLPPRLLWSLFPAPFCSNLYPEAQESPDKRQDLPQELKEASTLKAGRRNILQRKRGKKGGKR
jgi:hypothetical protein